MPGGLVVRSVGRRGAELSGHRWKTRRLRTGRCPAQRIWRFVVGTAGGREVESWAGRTTTRASTRRGRVELATRASGGVVVFRVPAGLRACVGLTAPGRGLRWRGGGGAAAWREGVSEMGRRRRVCGGRARRRCGGPFAPRRGGRRRGRREVAGTDAGRVGGGSKRRFRWRTAEAATSGMCRVPDRAGGRIEQADGGVGDQRGWKARRCRRRRWAIDTLWAASRSSRREGFAEAARAGKEGRSLACAPAWRVRGGRLSRTG